MVNKSKRLFLTSGLNGQLQEATLNFEMITRINETDTLNMNKLTIKNDVSTALISLTQFSNADQKNIICHAPRPLTRFP